MKAGQNMPIGRLSVQSFAKSASQQPEPVRRRTGPRTIRREKILINTG